MNRQGPILPLLRGTTTFESAVEQEEDMLLGLDYPEQRIDFFVGGGVNEWVHGSFNSLAKRALIRFPLPYKVGETTYPGNADDKIRCEAATFIWLQDNCPDISIPQLWGFGLVGGHSFTRPENTPLIVRIPWYIKRSVSWLFGWTLPSPYVCHRHSTILENGYLVMDYVGSPEAQMLSETWDENRNDQDKRANLFRGLSQIMLSLSRTPLPCIGSWTLDFDGVLRLSNRPLTLRLHQLENGGVPTNISRGMTYTTADSYYLDLLSCHDNRLRYQPNSLNDEEDGRAQMASLAIMRALLPQFTDRQLRQGPYLYQFTDMHPSNIFVDSQWHVKCVVDLEWACSLPAETLHLPYWLTGRPIDDLTGESLNTFSQTYDEFLGVFKEEEKSFPLNDNSCWRTGSFWYFLALNSPKGLFNLVHQHIHPIFDSTHPISSELPRVVSNYWAADMKKVIDAKIRDKEEYEKTLRQRFAYSTLSRVPRTFGSRADFPL
ncbi:hypothetical protein P168DRAFT_295141 [Aspergillus campestris IBT 28561]|uniref:Aminoglycoside phosphotransferase domain-containing protein n=1 Tax=Aspergillus campestris (strain IBT 28561) TaxID=1392248 RepID=A0A2I1DBF9_ASPC2|nr:uncharacterized protein P168DRAFT_295141 [Aspergillus campestris IBT 28561]PKY07201.1 hypothetical protein P168DRAFT_295141 [Aspergillus campestris IBT 28561]